jgi:uncharacterized membrane protein
MKRNRRLFALIFLALLLPVAARAQASGTPAPDPTVKDPKSMGQVAQQWWSFAGAGDRESTSQANIQYFIQYLFGDHWQIGMTPNILIDWKADQDNRFTVPVGLGIGKLVMIGPLPVKFTAEVDYMVVRQDEFGQHWGARFQIIPVLPALFKDTLF